MAVKKKRPRSDAVKDAAKAHTSLCIFEAAASMVEGSDVDSAYYVRAQQIAKLCRDAEGRCLRDYDRFVAEASKD